MTKYFDSDSELSDEYDEGYGSPDDDPPTPQEINIRECKQLYQKIFWYIIILCFIYSLIVTKLENLYLNLNQMFVRL